MCSRSVASAEQTIQEEIVHPGEGGYTVDPVNIIVKELDLGSLPSIKRFADDFLATESRLDLLILNAGIMALPKREETDAGFEKQIGVNHFGHAYLTSLLEDRLLQDKKSFSRVVVLSSTAHDMGTIRIEDLHFNKGRKYDGWKAYGQSKLANLLFAKALADKFAAKKMNATALSVHPGVIKTKLWRSTKLSRLHFLCVTLVF